MQISSVSYPQYSAHVFFEAKKPPKKLISTAKDKLGPRPSRELLEDLINNGMTNQEIAKKLKRAVQTIIGLRCIYKLPSEYELSVQNRTPQIIEQLLAGVSRKDIAKAFGICTGTVNSIAEKYKIFDQKKLERDKKICQLIKEGHKRKDIANLLGISVDTVKRTANEYNLIFKTRSRIHDKTILEKLQQNQTNKQIMEDLNISNRPIQRVKKENGLNRVYHKLPQPQIISWVEIMEESKKVSDIRRAFKRLKEGERTPEILEQISTKLEELKIAVDEFRSRFIKDTI